LLKRILEIFKFFSFLLHFSPTCESNYELLQIEIFSSSLLSSFQPSLR